MRAPELPQPELPQPGPINPAASEPDAEADVAEPVATDDSGRAQDARTARGRFRAKCSFRAGTTNVVRVG